MENNVQSLGTLGEDISQALLIPLMTSKLPRLVMVQLEMKRGGKAEWSVQTLRYALAGYVGALEAVEWATGDRHNEVSGTRSVPTHSMLTQAPQMFRCFYCSQPHFSDECTKYKGIGSRRSKLTGIASFA